VVNQIKVRKSVETVGESGAGSDAGSAGNREQGIGNREQGTGNREQKADLTEFSSAFLRPALPVWAPRITRPLSFFAGFFRPWLRIWGSDGQRAYSPCRDSASKIGSLGRREVVGAFSVPYSLIPVPCICRILATGHFPHEEFTLDEAQSLLPVLESLLKRAIEGKQAAEEVEGALSDLARRIYLSGGMRVDVAKVAKQRAEIETHLKRVRESIAEIDSIGVQVKDFEAGRWIFPAGWTTRWCCSAGAWARRRLSTGTRWSRVSRAVSRWMSASGGGRIRVAGRTEKQLLATSCPVLEIRSINPEVQTQILRLTTPKLHPTDEDLSAGPRKLKKRFGAPFRTQDDRSFYVMDFRTGTSS